MKKWLLCMSLVTGLGFTLSGQAQLVGDRVAGKTKAMACMGCHGADGNSVQSSFPKLAGQGQAYLVKQLQDYQNGHRQNDVMVTMVASLSQQDMVDIAAFYASNTTTIESMTDVGELGQRIYNAGNRESGIPACKACHGPGGKGIPAAKWPALAGQHSAYSQLQLAAFANGQRSNDPNSMMRDIARRLTPEELTAVSDYTATLE